MARPRLTDQSDAEFSEAIDVEHEDASKIEKDIRDEETEIQAHFGESDGDPGMYFQVRKVVPESKDKPFCLEGTRADFPILPKIQARFGGGKYEVWIFKNKRIYRRMQVAILAPMKDETPQAVTPSSDPAFKELIALMREQGEKKSKSILDGVSLPELLTGGAAILTAMKALMGNQQQAPDPLQSIQATLALIETAKSISGGGEERETTLMDVFKSVMQGPMLEKILATADANKPNATPLQLPSPATTPLTPEQARNAQLAQVKAQIDFLISRAIKGSAPDLYADVMEDSLAPDLLALFRQPGAVELLIGIHPGVAQFRPWFEALLQSLANPPIEENPANGAANINVPQPNSAPVETGFDAQRNGWGTGYVESDGDEGARG